MIGMNSFHNFGRLYAGATGLTFSFRIPELRHGEWYPSSDRRPITTDELWRNRCDFFARRYGYCDVNPYPSLNNRRKKKPDLFWLFIT